MGARTGTSAPQVVPVDIARFVVPFDGSERAQRAADVARTLSAQTNVPVGFVAVDTPMSDRAELTDALARAAQGAETTVVRRTEVADALLDVVHRMPDSVVCIGSHGRGRSAAVLGSVASDIVSRSHEAVIVVGPHVEEETGPIGQVIACLDGSLASEDAIPVAIAWARALGTPVRAVTVAEPVPASVAGNVYHRHHGPSVDAEAYMRALSQRWAGAEPALETEALFDPVSVTDALTDLLEDGPPALVVVATHARRGVARIAFGSMAARIVHAVPAPVLLVPEQADAEEWDR